MSSASIPAVAASALLLGAAACSGGGSRGSGPPPAGPPTPTSLGLSDEVPQVLVLPVSLSGASGPLGTFQPGDRPALRFRLEQSDGTRWALEELSSGRSLLSGPTKNYQRVLPAADDVLATAIQHGDGSYTYRFAPLPAVYAAPYHDTEAFGVEDGERTGQPLADGTYTLGLSFTWAYDVLGEAGLQVGEETVDFLLGGGAGELAPRAVTSAENCNRCHVRLEAHGGRYRKLTMCLMCHTAGAEDLNDPAVEGGSPGVTIDSRVLFHRIHNGSHLPSVVGLTLDETGFWDYTAEPQPLRVVGAGGLVRDYSEVGFPAFPNRVTPMPAGFLYDFLTPDEKRLEDRIRTGVTACSLCHGDPDGAGPIEAPAQGELIFAQLSRKACGACHDHVDFDFPVLGDFGEMEPQPDDTGCQECHFDAPDNPMAPRVAHRHPLLDPGFNPGIEVELLAVEEGGLHDGDGTLDPGEGLALTLTLRDGFGFDLDPALLDRVTAAVSGPTSNANLIHLASIPSGLLAGPQPFRIPLTDRRELEFVGDAGAASGETFFTLGAPHHDLAGSATTLSVRVGLGGASAVTAAAVPAGHNFLDLAADPGFQRGDVIVLADGTPAEEYLEVQWVDGLRLWFSSPALPDLKAATVFAHGVGTTVERVLLEPRTAGVDFALDPLTGAVTELVEFGAGNAVLVGYTTDFVLPAVYPPPLNDSPDLGETLGEWSAKGLVDGTYTVGLWAGFEAPFDKTGSVNPYRVTSEAATREILVGAATSLEPYALLDDLAACNDCHQDLAFHDDTARGLAACLLCHGNAGSEDLPRYTAAGAPDTTGARTDLRSMVHRIHHARLLDDPEAFELVGPGPDPYPDNFEVNRFSSILFPAQPGATRRCAKCHGEANAAWREPAPRDHPSEQIEPAAVWFATCTACHDAPVELDHMAAFTSPLGLESCADCHGPGQEYSVENVHRPR